MERRRRGGEGKVLDLMEARFREEGEGNRVGREDFMMGGKFE